MPLFVLGIIRVMVHSAIGYNYSVIEYGLHWNFFITLGVVMASIMLHIPMFHIDFINISQTVTNTFRLIISRL